MACKKRKKTVKRATKHLKKRRRSVYEDYR